MIYFSPCVYCGNWNRVMVCSYCKDRKCRLCFYFFTGLKTYHLPYSVYKTWRYRLCRSIHQYTGHVSDNQLCNVPCWVNEHCFISSVEEHRSAESERHEVRFFIGNFSFAVDFNHLAVDITELLLWWLTGKSYSFWQLTVKVWQKCDVLQISFLNFRVLQNTSSCTDWCKYQRVKLKSITEYRNWTA